MSSAVKELVGRGVYSVAEAAQLTKVPTPRIQRWIRGYSFVRDGDKRASPAIWHRDFELVGGHIALSFLDMMEVRFIQCFREHKVSWPAIREAARKASEMFNDGHPFTNGRFRTDGKTIFRQIEKEAEVKLFDINRQQWVFNDIVEPSLFHDVEFSDEQVVRWYPNFPSKKVVIDPRICFGRPIVADCGIPTETLAATAQAEGSIAIAAKLFRVRASHVQVAVKFEERAAA